MLVVSSAGGRCGIQQAMGVLRAGGTALEAVIIGLELLEREGAERAGSVLPGGSAEHRASARMLLTSDELVGDQPDVWCRWRARLMEEMRLETNALSRLEWLVGLATAALGPAAPVHLASFAARDRACDIACGVAVHEIARDAGATQRAVLALRAGRPLGEALHEVMNDLRNLLPPFGDRFSMHTLARDRIPIGASHRQGETFLYLHNGMGEYAERTCLYVA